MKNFIPTIIIVSEVHALERGYPLIGREFVLKEPIPREDIAITLDNAKIQDKYWVVDINEYIRVVPEASKDNFSSNEIYIPTWVAKVSFRPGYIKSSPSVLF